jgi:hypothetical protein
MTVPFRGFRVGQMLRARAATSRGVGPAANAGGVAPRCRRHTGYWLPRCSGRQRPRAVFHARGAMRRVSSPSKILPLQGETVSTRPVRVRAGPEIALLRRRSSGFLSWGFKDAPPSISARCVRSRRGRLATIPAFGQGDATLPGAFRPCRSSRLRRFAPLRASQGPRSRGPSSARAESAPGGVSPATDHGVHAVSAPAALSALSRSALVPFGARSARIGRGWAACSGASPVMPYPSKRFPRQQPSRRHRRAIPSRRFRPLRWPETQLRTARSDSAGVCRPQGLAPLPSP